MTTNLYHFEALLGFQKQGPGNKSLLSLITDEITANQYTRISACAAYASYQGVVMARSLLANERNSFRWLIGLDDYITDPQAIKVAAGIHNSETRIVPVTAGRRFHAKAYLLDHAADDRATLIVGSANLTKAALTKNCEGYVLLRATTKEEVELFRNYWDLFWKLGEPASAESIAEYEERYKKRRVRAPEVEEESTAQPLPPREAKLVKKTLGSSKLAWIELGNNTGPKGRQLDIVKKLAPFLGLPDNGTDGLTVFRTFNSETGSKQYQLTFAKGMWRFMNLQQGFTKTLRPNMKKPSPYLLIISRNRDGSVPTLTLERVGSNNATRMIQESETNGFIDSSTHDDSGRLFGWY